MSQLGSRPNVITIYHSGYRQSRLLGQRLTKRLYTQGIMLFPVLVLFLSPGFALANNCGRREWNYTVYGFVLLMTLSVFPGTFFQAWASYKSLSLNYFRAAHLFCIANIFSLVFASLLLFGSQMFLSGIGNALGVKNPLDFETDNPPTVLQAIFHSYVAPGGCQSFFVRCNEPGCPPNVTDKNLASAKAAADDGMNGHLQWGTTFILGFFASWMIGYYFVRRDGRVESRVARWAVFRATLLIFGPVYIFVTSLL